MTALKAAVGRGGTASHLAIVRRMTAQAIGRSGLIGHKSACGDAHDHSSNAIAAHRHAGRYGHVACHRRAAGRTFANGIQLVAAAGAPPMAISTAALTPRSANDGIANPVNLKER